MKWQVCDFKAILGCIPFIFFKKELGVENKGGEEKEKGEGRKKKEIEKEKK